MPTWTDDDGVTHAAKQMVTTCYRMVASEYGPCDFDDPPKMLTCMACAAGGGSMGQLLEYLEEINKANDAAKAFNDGWLDTISKMPMTV